MGHGGELDADATGRHGENDEQGTGSLPPWLGWARQHGLHGFRPKPEKENNPLLTSIKNKR
jgi:hypothetical protein